MTVQSNCNNHKTKVDFERELGNSHDRIIMEVSIRVVDSSLSEKKQCIFVDTLDVLLVNIRHQVLEDGLYLPDCFAFVTKNGNQITNQQEKQLKISHICNQENGVKAILVKSTESSEGTTMGTERSQPDETENRVAQVPVNPEELLTISTSEGKTFLVRVRPRDKIKDVKQKIYKEKGIPTSEQELYCNGMPLEDQTDVKVVKPGAIINLLKKTRKMTLYLEKTTGTHEIFTVMNISPDDVVEKIKCLASMQTGLRNDEIRLIFAGKQLDDGRTLSFYNIQNESKLYIVFRLRGS